MNRLGPKPMGLAYLFGDEQWPGGTLVPEVRVAAILVDQSRWSRSAIVTSATRGDRLLDSIGSCATRIVIGQVCLDVSECPPGSVHEFPDIGKMAGRDHLLVDCLGWTIAHLLFRSALERDGFHEVGLYLDRLQLTRDLRPRFQDALLGSIDRAARRDLEAAGLDGVESVKPQQLNWVSKPLRGCAPDRFQLGVRAAHLALARDPARVNQLGGKLHTLDLTTTLRNTWSKMRLP
jgi:hypothetical protein